jgi:hypothetical protein
MLFGIWTFVTSQKQRIIDCSAKSIRILSMTLNRLFASVIESDRRSAPAKAQPPISTRSEGMQNDESDEQLRNAEAPMRESLESDLTVTVDSFEQESKQ